MRWMSYTLTVVCQVLVSRPRVGARGTPQQGQLACGGWGAILREESVGSFSHSQ